VGKRVSLAYLIPLTLTAFFAYMCTYILSMSKICELVETPFIREETYSATLYNTALLMSMIVVGSIMLYIFIKLKKLKILEAIVKVLVILSIYSVVTVYGISLCIIVGLEFLDIVSFNIAAIAASLLMAYLILFAKKRKLVALSTIFFGSSIGAIFGSTLPSWTILAASAVVALWDIYAVFRGPLRTLVDEIKSIESTGRKSKEPGFLRGIAFSYGGVLMGLGDVVFYSMIMALSLISPTFSALRFIVVSSSIVIGAFITLKLLEKYRRALPGLPIPVFLSIIVYLVLTQLNL